MTPLKLKISEALEKTRRFSLGEDVQFQKVVNAYKITTIFYCDMCGNKLKKQYNGYYYCECE